MYSSSLYPFLSLSYYDSDDNNDDDEYTNTFSASCSLYPYAPHFPSPSFLISLYIIVITGPAKDCSWSVQESHPACTGGAAVYPQYRGAFRRSDDQGV